MSSTYDPALVRAIRDEVLRSLRGMSNPPQDYFSIEQAAAILGIAPKTLRMKHENGTGPRVTKIPGSHLVRFHRTAIDEWLAAAQAERGK